MKISDNFMLYEATRSNTAAKYDIDNKPSTKTLIQIVHTAVNMQAVRSALGNTIITVSSWYRSVELNTHPDIGGSINSGHIEGTTVDFRAQGLTTRETFNIIRNSGIKYKKLILEFEDRGDDSWIHIKFPKIGEYATRKNLVATEVNGETIYTEVN